VPKSILEIRALVKTKIAEGVLPPIHAGNYPVDHGRGRRCDCCEQMIAEYEFQTDVDLTGTVTLHFHLRCFGVWQAEVDKLGQIVDITDSRAFFRPVGAASLGEAVGMVSSAIVYARENAASRLLVNLSALRGFAPPTIVQRYGLAAKWAAAARGRLRLAVVAKDEMIHPQKVGITFAATAGLVSDVFVSEAEALAWLETRTWLDTAGILDCARRTIRWHPPCEGPV
jgi:hypothetical protein